MAIHSKFVAVVVASLLAGALPARIAPLGVVMHAERAHVGEAEASVGCSIFEGDRLSTEAGGILRITIPSLTLQLGGQSSMELGHAAGAQANILAELGSGTLVLSAAPTGTIVVAANEALIRSAANAATVAQVRLVNRKELRIFVQRGALEFSYHGDSETMSEGKAYRVLLDPSEREVAASGSDQAPNRPWNHRRTFILVSIAVAVAAGIAIPVIIHDVESPDRPGPTPPKKP